MIVNRSKMYVPSTPRLFHWTGQCIVHSLPKSWDYVRQIKVIHYPDWGSSSFFFFRRDETINNIDFLHSIVDLKFSNNRDLHPFRTLRRKEFVVNNLYLRSSLSSFSKTQIYPNTLWPNSVHFLTKNDLV